MDFSWLAKISSGDLFVKLMVIALFIGLVIVGVVFLLRSLSRFKGGLKIKGKDGGEIDFSGSTDRDYSDDHDENIIQALEVRDYKHTMRIVFDDIKDDIRAGITENGWNKMSRPELANYFERAIKDHDIKLTNFLNDYYYFNALVTRVALYNWNEKIKNIVDDKYHEMYSTLDRITQGAYKEIAEKEAILNKNKADKSLCSPTMENCQKTTIIIDQVIELFLDKTVRIKRKCMTEVERYLNDIRQLYYSHYLTIYKRALSEKGE